MGTRNIILGVMAAFAMMSCGGNASKADGELATDSVKFEEKSKTQEIKIVFDYPTSGNQNLKNSIEEYISETLGGTYMGTLDNKDSLMQYYVAEQKDYLKKSLDDMEGYDGDALTLTAEIRKAYETDQFVTYEYYTYEYLGGAHGMQYTGGATFRKSDGRRFAADILSNKRNIDYEEFNTLLKDGIKQYFSDNGEKMTDKELQDAIVSGDYVESLPLPKTAPYLTKDGVVFIYQPYEIFCYAAGAVKFTVPLDKIKPFLNAAVLKMID